MAKIELKIWDGPETARDGAEDGGSQTKEFAELEAWKKAHLVR